MADMKEDRYLERTVVNPDTASHLGPTLEIKGELRTRESLTISGRFLGRLDLGRQDLIIAAGGHVEAEIQGRDIVIRGTLIGNIHASGRIVIETSAQVVGDISGSSVSIQEGAKFKGSVRMISAKLTARS